MHILRRPFASWELWDGESRRSASGHPLQPHGWVVARGVVMMVVSGLLALLAPLGPLGLGPQTAHAATSPLSQLQDYNAIGSSPTFVQHHPKVYLVFWGPKWSTDTGTIATIEHTFQALAGSQYNNILTQYTDSGVSSDPVNYPNDHSVPSPTDLKNGNYVHNDVELMTAPSGSGAPYGRVIDTSSPPGGIDIGIESPTGVLWGAQIRNEADKEIANLGLAVNQDSQIIVFPQQGTTYNSLSQPQNWCGMHVFNSTAAHHYAYALVQYGDQNPSCGTAASDIAFTAVHEYAEAATDPVIAAQTLGTSALGSGWHLIDLTANSPQETADLCASQGEFSYYPTSLGGPYWLPYLWSNVSNGVNSGCVNAIGQEYASPDTAYPFHGQHTVQGAILGLYTANGGSSGVLHAPLTEETPIGNGRVSYFNDTCGGITRCAGIYWSASTGTYLVRAANFSEYQAVGDAGGSVGFPVSGETAMGTGVVQYFNANCGGTTPCAGIYWSSGTGSHLVRAADFSEYQAVGQASGVVGFPTNDELGMNGGSVQYFAAGCAATTPCAGIYWSSGTGSHLVRAADFSEYRASGEANGPLAFPAQDEIAITGGSAQYFTANHACGTPGPSSSDGAIYWSSGTGSHEVHGCIYAFYVTTSGATGGSLGFPLSDEQGITDRYGHGGQVNYFTGNHGCGSPGPYGSDGAIYWTGSAAFQSYGCIYGTYITYGGGGPGGPLGFPTSNEYTNSLGQREQTFANGTITWVNGQGQICLGVTC